jgi:type IV pilus assembly protein PilM
LDAIVSKRAEVNTLVANPFAGMTTSPKIKARQLALDAPALVVATGLAMRRFDV